MIRRFRLASSVVAVSTAVVATLFAASPAVAEARNVGTVSGVVDRCDTSPYLLCLFFRSNFTGAYWGANDYVSNLSSARFIGPGDGAGTAVRNRAASMSCDTSVSGDLWCWSYVSPNRGGNVDYLLPQNSGTLALSRNNEASVDIF